MNSVTVDPVWEEKYSSGHCEHAPWDAVVTFIFRHAPRDRSRSDVRILEIGCGTGSNLLFAAQQGFSVTGLDCSPSAIKTANDKFSLLNLNGDLRVGDFTSLPFGDNTFDLVVDRGALTCVGQKHAATAVAEVHRVIRQGGYFYLNPYSERHSSRASGKRGPDGLRYEISEGTLTGVGQICFYGRGDVEQLLDEGWQIKSLIHIESVEVSCAVQLTHAEWRTVAVAR